MNHSVRVPWSRLHALSSEHFIEQKRVKGKKRRLSYHLCIFQADIAVFIVSSSRKRSFSRRTRVSGCEKETGHLDRREAVCSDLSY